MIEDFTLDSDHSDWHLGSALICSRIDAAQSDSVAIADTLVVVCFSLLDALKWCKRMRRTLPECEPIDPADPVLERPRKQAWAVPLSDPLNGQIAEKMVRASLE